MPGLLADIANIELKRLEIPQPSGTRREGQSQHASASTIIHEWSENISTSKRTGSIDECADQ